jgi:hypothetical protein
MVSPSEVISSYASLCLASSDLSVFSSRPVTRLMF